MEPSDELQKLTALFQQWGAACDQAEVMAGQLLKKADQMAVERNIPRMEALEYLLKVVAAGREGTAYDGPKPGTPPKGE